MHWFYEGLLNCWSSRLVKNWKVPINLEDKEMLQLLSVWNSQATDSPMELKSVPSKAEFMVLSTATLLTDCSLAWSQIPVSEHKNQEIVTMQCWIISSAYLQSSYLPSPWVYGDQRGGSPNGLSIFQMWNPNECIFHLSNLAKLLQPEVESEGLAQHIWREAKPSGKNRATRATGTGLNLSLNLEPSAPFDPNHCLARISPIIGWQYGFWLSLVWSWREMTWQLWLSGQARNLLLD